MEEASPEEAITYQEEPIRQIASLLGGLHINWGFQRCHEDTPNQWMFFVNCNGIHPKTTCKGYIWTADTLDPVLESLDGKAPANRDSYDRAYAAVTDNWYLIHELWPGHGGRCGPRR